MVSRLKEDDRKMGEHLCFTGKQDVVQTHGRGQEDVGASLVHREPGWCPDSRKRTGRCGSVPASQGTRVVSRLKEGDRKMGEHP